LRKNENHEKMYDRSGGGNNGKEGITAERRRLIQREVQAIYCG